MKDKPNGGLVFLPDAIRLLVHASLSRSLQWHCPRHLPPRLFCVAGGLMSYGINLDKLYVAPASYVDPVSVAPNERNCRCKSPLNSS